MSVMAIVQEKILGNMSEGFMATFIVKANVARMVFIPSKNNNYPETFLLTIIVIVVACTLRLNLWHSLSINERYPN